MFAVGDKVVYPHHGAAEIVRVEQRDFEGKSAPHLVMVTHDGETTISVPVEKAAAVGVRPPVPADEVDEVRAVLAKRNVREPANWARRFKNHQSKMRSGDVFELAEVVRNLELRVRRKPLSHAEVDMLKRARVLLSSELCCSLGCDAEQALVEVDAALA